MSHFIIIFTLLVHHYVFFLVNHSANFLVLHMGLINLTLSRWRFLYNVNCFWIHIIFWNILRIYLLKYMMIMIDFLCFFNLFCLKWIIWCLLTFFFRIIFWSYFLLSLLNNMLMHYFGISIFWTNKINALRLFILFLQPNNYFLSSLLYNNIMFMFFIEWV